MLTSNIDKATPEERLANYAAGQRLMRGMNPNTVPAGEIGIAQRISKYFKGAKSKHIAHNPIVPNMADYVNWILYDRSVFAAGAAIPTNFNLFTVPINTNNKTKVDTNLEQVSQLPQPYWMNVTGIGFHFANINALETDINNFENQSYMEFWVNNKCYIEGPIQCFPSGAGVYGVTQLTGQSVLGNGWPSNSNIYDLRLPGGVQLGVDPASGAPIVTDGITGITILQSQVFQVKINLPGGALTLTANNATPNVGTGLTVQCFLHGILSRSVQ